MNNWKNEPTFQALDPQKKQMILLLSEALEGKKMTEALPVLLEWKQTMQKQGVRFSSEENQLLTKLFTSELTPAGRQRFEYLKQFLH